jgi:excisionase family DNA binding protein
MPTTEQLLSPKQLSRSLGVSESSLKRWCDQGRIKTVRTAGGHRKIAVADALRYAREQNLEFASRELLRLPGKRSSTTLDKAVEQMTDALLQGSEQVTRRIALDLYASNHACSVICDEVIGAAFREIGERWACNTADVYQERRACEIMQRVLFELRRMQPPTSRHGTAAGGTVEGDHYSLANAMAELVLRESGFSATSIGTSLPWSSLVNAVEQMKVDLFWLSVSHIPNIEDFVTSFTKLSNACATAGTALVVGGRALTDDVRKRITYSAFCDNLQHMESFAKTLRRTPRSSRRGRAAAKPSSRAGRK